MNVTLYTKECVCILWCTVSHSYVSGSGCKGLDIGMVPVMRTVRNLRVYGQPFRPTAVTQNRNDVIS